MHVHFIAVSGTGMGSLAGLFKAAGHRVTGSDVAFHPPMGPALERWGVELRQGFDPRHLDPRPDLVVVGNVCRPWNPEARAAIDGGLAVTDMAHALAEHMLSSCSPLVVAGTHGKTTTTSLCAHLLHACGHEPGFLVGGLPANFEHSFRQPKRRLPRADAVPNSRRGVPFVVEGDEYDTAFFEKTPKFWHYRPEVAVITSIEHDHIDIYPDEASYLDAFRGFVSRLPPDGLVVASADDRRVAALVAEHSRAQVVGYALEGDELGSLPPHWFAAPAVVDERGQSFDVYAGGTFAGRAWTCMPGRHNVRNALAALAAVCQGYGVSLSQAMSALQSFRGVKRRQELLGEPGGVRVYDDFAHHPTAVSETLRALRQRHPTGRLVVAYEPRSATACRSLHQAAYATAFERASLVVLAPVGRPELPDDQRLDTKGLCQALRDRAVPAEAATSIDAIIEIIAAEVSTGDTVALLSNGAFGGIHPKLMLRLASERLPARSDAEAATAPAGSPTWLAQA